MEAKAFLLNSKSILECVKEEEKFEHVLEINKIMNTIIKKYDFPCALLCKYQDEYNKHIFTQIKRCNLSEVKNKINDCIYPSPTKWLKGIMDSKLTIVDSFHGMVFSIIFNKPFWVIGNVKRGMTRFASLLEKLGLEDRLITVEDLEKVDLLQPIDWIKVNALKDKKKNESLALLFNALENE